MLRLWLGLALRFSAAVGVRVTGRVWCRIRIRVRVSVNG